LIQTIKKGPIRNRKKFFPIYLDEGSRMTEIYTLATLWLGLALLATLLSIWFRVATALSEIVVGTVAQLVIGAALGGALLGTDHTWIKFLSGTGAILLTFLAGAELDPVVFKMKWREASMVGLASFAAPFLGCTAVAYWLLHWTAPASWLAGIAMSTTSVAVVYAVMLELGLNQTNYGKTVLAACFVTDLGTVVALGLIFSPFTLKTAAFTILLLVLGFVLPWLTPRFFKWYGGRPSELEAKYLLFFLFGLGALALWADSEAVLPAYLIGMVLAGTVGKDHALIRRLRTLTFGLLTPFYFIRAGSLVSVPSLISAPLLFIIFLATKVFFKFVAVLPVSRIFNRTNGLAGQEVKTESIYMTLLMSTGLTFGSIASLFGLTHNLIDRAQYSYLVAAVIASAVVPTMIANALYLPRHLLNEKTGQPDQQKL
jgi:glutathione-regulated potassium-efflux system ancillary protein KefC